MNQNNITGQKLDHKITLNRSSSKTRSEANRAIRRNKNDAENVLIKHAPAIKSIQSTQNTNNIVNQTDKLKDLGIDKSSIDERLMWTVKKSTIGLMKLRLVLEDKGVDEAKRNEIIDKLVDGVKNKDLSKIKEWHEKHKAEHQDK